MTPVDNSRFSIGFSPQELLEESQESFTLESFDRVNSTNVREFIMAADEQTLVNISYICMEDERVWDVYWKVIYDAALELQRKQQIEAAAAAARKAK
jgi:hypothetical protein